MSEPDAHVCLTFDVDAESLWRDSAEDPANNRLSQLSWGRFGITRGVPRILGLLERLDLHATFFIPGATAELHGAALRPIVRAGHEIGHHGHDHRFSPDTSATEQRREITRGFDALERHLGVVPSGYRSPMWEVTPVTFAEIVDRGFLYDSSFMGDDRPYVERHGDRSILELPSDWTLDDFPHFGASRDFHGSLQDPARVFAAWQAEVDSAIADRRTCVLAFHPEVIGRGWVFGPFSAFVERLHADPRVAVERCIDVARRVGPQLIDERMH